MSHEPSYNQRLTIRLAIISGITDEPLLKTYPQLSFDFCCEMINDPPGEEEKWYHKPTLINMKNYINRLLPRTV